MDPSSDASGCAVLLQQLILIGLGELPYIFFTDECAVHSSDRHCHVLLGAKNTRTLHRSWNTFRHT